MPLTIVKSTVFSGMYCTESMRRTAEPTLDTITVSCVVVLSATLVNSTGLGSTWICGTGCNEFRKTDAS